MDGIINILKPPGMTSFDVIAHLRRVLKTKKIGHTGTLDPDAAGVLPVCAGKATKAIEYMMEKDKLYRAEMVLGVSTDTQDSSGEITGKSEVRNSISEISDTILGFRGKYLQTPPMYSALKFNGKKLYELAREGITIERQAREVNIYELKVLDISRAEATVKVVFDISCSKGTYIRTLCSDIGDRLGCGGHMSFLLRMKAGEFDISSSVTLEEVEASVAQNNLDSKIVAVEEVFRNYNKIQLSHNETKKYINGVIFSLNREDIQEGEAAVFDNDNRFLGIGSVSMTSEGTMLKSKKLFL
ncbi:MAG: tRNA pseudouridine(55) synthase TruB [Bacillota bacterium]|nr:tRNA pseudouridine(55) synthase TruB [Bacillota bacterium]